MNENRDGSFRRVCYEEMKEMKHENEKNERDENEEIKKRTVLTLDARTIRHNVV
jgi:hypothetical protein